MTPSKELFEAVKGFAVNGDTFKVSDKVIHYDYLDHEGQYPHTCTINDFFFEVKDWAKNKGYSFVSGIDADYPDDNWNLSIKADFGMTGKPSDVYVCYIELNTHRHMYNRWVNADTEQEAVFKAAEYILNQQDKGYDDKR
jgi:hypothetical protein